MRINLEKKSTRCCARVDSQFVDIQYCNPQQTLEKETRVNFPKRPSY